MKRMVTITVVLSMICGCHRQSADSNPTAESNPSIPAISTTPRIEGLPVTLQVKQRSTADIPGTNNTLSVTVDDITRDQAMISIHRGKEGNLFGPISMKEGDSKIFLSGGSEYSIKISELNNRVIGTDDTTLIIADADSSTISEVQKIEQLISSVESLTDAVFIRNGSEHTPQQAAEHLRRKLESSAGKISTVEDFIDQIAAGSSISGEDYQIRFSDGRTMLTRDFLKNELDIRFPKSS